MSIVKILTRVFSSILAVIILFLVVSFLKILFDNLVSIIDGAIQFTLIVGENSDASVLVRLSIAALHMEIDA